jgi:hypothetical protein
MCHKVTRKPPPPEDPEKKERVIHTRVPESLEAHLRERAQELGVSVSNLVRNVLGHAFGLVGDVVADGHAIARAARGDKDRPPAATDEVIGWHSITLAKNAVCTRCNAILAKGKPASIGMTERGAVGPIVCPTCTEGHDE